MGGASGSVRGSISWRGRRVWSNLGGGARRDKNRRRNQWRCGEPALWRQLGEKNRVVEKGYVTLAAMLAVASSRQGPGGKSCQRASCYVGLGHGRSEATHLNFVAQARKAQRSMPSGRRVKCPSRHRSRKFRDQKIRGTSRRPLDAPKSRPLSSVPQAQDAREISAPYRPSPLISECNRQSRC